MRRGVETRKLEKRPVQFEHIKNQAASCTAFIAGNTPACGISFLEYFVESAEWTVSLAIKHFCRIFQGVNTSTLWFSVYTYQKSVNTIFVL